jgi:hypothetical protein
MISLKKSQPLILGVSICFGFSEQRNELVPSAHLHQIIARACCADRRDSVAPTRWRRSKMSPYKVLGAFVQSSWLLSADSERITGHLEGGVAVAFTEPNWLTA